MKISASSLKAAKCLRRWAGRALARIEMPLNADQLKARHFGTRLHGYAEDYVKTGNMPPENDPAGALLLKGLHLLPKPGEGETEENFTFEFEGVEFTGKIDVKRVNRTTGRTSIEDHKTSADPAKYGETDKSLKKDEQAILYAAAHFATPDITREYVEIAWNYFPKKSGKPFAVRTTLSAEHVDAHMHTDILPRARQMLALKTIWVGHAAAGGDQIDPVRRLNMIPNTPAACDCCGRMCDYAPICKMF